MALPVEKQLRYWGIAAAVFLVMLWLLGDVILPFLVGGAVAYFLDPVADRLQRLGLGRLLATIIIMAFLLMIAVVAVLLVVPTLVRQTQDLIQIAPQLFDDLRAFLSERFPGAMDEDSALRDTLLTIGQRIQERGAELLNTVLRSAGSVVNALVFLIVAPVVAFYMLLDWDRMIARIDALLPRDHQATIRDLAGQIDRTLAGFVRGQGTVCLILGTFYAVALMTVGLQFGVVVGFIAGLLTFIPYIGALVGGLLAVGLALFQFWGEWWWIVAVAAIFQFGQFVEGNFLTPNLVGSSIGLHPVWLIFALSAFGALFGFVGLLVAVPVAAMIGVLVRYGIGRYQESLLYHGTTRTASAAAAAAGGRPAKDADAAPGAGASDGGGVR